MKSLPFWDYIISFLDYIIRSNGIEALTGFRFKPIFHCNTKYLASGVGVGQCPRCQNYALEIPTCWYILALPNAKICVTPDTKPKICVTPDANPRRQSVEYRWRWVPNAKFLRWACTFHVHFMLFMSISCASGTQRKLVFQWIWA